MKKQDILPIIFHCDDVPVLFRPMKSSDYSVVRELVPEVSRCSKIYTLEEFEVLLNLPTYHPCCAFRQDNEKLVGFLELIRLPHIGRKFDARLERVVVTEDFRNKGLATSMCRYIIEQANIILNCGRVELTVEKPEARYIYETKLGFTKVDTTVMRLLFPNSKE